MPRITADRTCLVIADKLSVTQREIHKMMLLQICGFVDNVEIIDFYENEKLEKFVESDEIPIVKVTDSWSCKDWDSTFKHFRNVLRHYRNMIIINSPTFRFMKEDKDSLIRRYEEKVLENPNYAYDANGKQIHDRILRLLFIKAASESFCRNNVYQFVINPGEVDYRNVWNFKHYKRIGPWPWENTELGPTYECALSQMYIQDVGKVYDLFWYACCYNKESVKELLSIVKVFLNKRTWNQPEEYINPVYGKCGLFDKNRVISDSMPQEEYYYNLMCSKYTIVSETDDGSFPIVRFMEAIILGCIPILQRIINFDDLILIEKRFYDIIKWKDLIIPEFKIYKTKSHYTKSVHVVSKRFKIQYGEDIDVIELLRKSKYYKYMTSQKYVEDYYKKLICGAKYNKRKG